MANGRSRPAASSASARKTTKQVQNFDLLADELLARYYVQAPNNNKCSKQHTKLAHKELKSSFSATRQNVRSTALTAAAVSINQPQTATPASNTRSSSAAVTPATPAPFSLVSPPEDEHSNPTRLDLCPIRMSSTIQGVKRLRISEIARLHKGEQFILVVSPPDVKQTAEARLQRTAVLSGFRNIVLAAAPNVGRMNKQQKDEYTTKQFAQSSFQREGRTYYEFNVEVNSYPERHKLEGHNAPLHLIANYIHPARIGLYLSLIGYGTHITFHLNCQMYAYVEVYKPRLPETNCLDESIYFPKSNDDKKHAAVLFKELEAARGDTTAYVQILMKYYQRQSYQLAEQVTALKKQTSTADKSTNGSNKNTNSNEVVDPIKTIECALKKELVNDSLVQFAHQIDNDYEKAMIQRCSDFVVPTSYLVSQEQIAQYYHELVKLFPYSHFVFATIASTNYYSVPVNNIFTEATNEEVSSDEEIHRKQRMILFVWFSLLRTRSRVLLKHWAVVDPFGHFAKGYKQPGRKSISGSFTSTLPTCWNRANKLYEEWHPTWNERLRGEMCVSGAFDNHQQVLPMKTQSNAKSAITHVGTAYYLKKDRPYELPAGTKMKSSCGIDFVVASCEEVSEYQYLVKGAILLHLSTLPLSTPNEGQLDEVIRSEQELIVKGFLWPSVDFTVLSVPGFHPRPCLTYHNQVVQPPRRAWVQSSATDADILLNSDGNRMFTSPATDDSVAFTTQRMKNIHCQAQRIIDMQSHLFYLERQMKNSEESIEEHEAISFGDEPPPAKLEYDSNTQAFMALMRECSSVVDRAFKFETDIVKLVNPKAGKVDRMFAFPIAPFDETSHDGMKMTYNRISNSFQMFRTEDNGRCILQPNATKRKIFLRVDQLSARNWRQLKISLTKKFTEMGNASSVRAMLDALDRYVVVHDYLHETRMHRQDVIYIAMYGSFLQPLQVHIAQKRVSGNPSKKEMQTHEIFLYTVDTALRRHQRTRFLASADPSFFASIALKNPQERVLALGRAYHDYCVKKESTSDEPTKVCALFLKYMDAYKRCHLGVKRSNFWMLEDEGCSWLGAFKSCGKTNYVTEIMHRIDALYGPDMTDDELEWLRINCFFVMTAGGNAVTLDELNEFLNLWNKSSVTSPNFATVCERSKHVLLSHACAYEAFGKAKPTKRTGASREANVASLVKVFAEADVFPVDASVNRKMTDSFFWNLVERPTNVGATKHHDKEKVERTAAEEAIYNIVCRTDAERNDTDVGFDADSDNDNESVVSSCMGSVASRTSNLVEDDVDTPEGDDGWERLEETEPRETIGQSLKHLGNVKKRPMSSLILKDLLGSDGALATKDIKKGHVKSIRKAKRRIDGIYDAVNYFEEKMGKRMKQLDVNIEKSTQKSYKRRRCEWRTEYKVTMTEKRSREQNE